MITVNRVRRAFYLDSVALMRHSRVLAGMDGVAEAAMMMGTPANQAIMREAGLLDMDAASAQGGDLIIGVRADTQAAAEAAVEEAARRLDQASTQITREEEWRPRSIRTAVAAAADTNLALISVPGAFAAAEARKAVRRGLHAMIFSDNVPLDEEISLKQEARDCGLLVMGPDCGTSIINGVPLAFANRVPNGNIAIVGASGTGIQEVSCLIAAADSGVTHAIGVGGRDMTDAVGGLSTIMALDLLEHDSGTDHIVIISKPPSQSVARKVIESVAESSKSFTICFIGAGSLELPPNAQFAGTLKSAALLAVGREPDDLALPTPRIAPKGRERIRGLFSGGTLCAEAQIVLSNLGRQVVSNAPVPGAMADTDAKDADRLIDLGADEYTQGRPHPMIDPSVRDAELKAALTDSSVAVILLDVVIGFGAHDDPAGHLAHLLDGAQGDAPLVIASVTGTEDDPQCRSSQAAKLERAGVLIAPSNADAAALALACLNR